MGGYRLLTLFVFLVDGVLGDAYTLNLVSVMEGEQVPLNTGVTKQQLDKMLWYFNDILIAQINGEASKSCLYDGEDGRFRNRVEVDYKTGSLNITNIRSEHAGRYEAEIIRSKSSGTSQSLNRNSKCDSTKITRKTSNIGDSIKTFIVSINTSLSAPDKTSEKLDETGKEPESDRIPDSGLFDGVVAGIVVVVLLVFVAVAAGVIYCCCRRSKNEVDKKKLEHLLNI